MKKIIFISFLLLSIQLFAQTPITTQTDTVNVHKLEQQLNNLQAQLNTLKKTEAPQSSTLAKASNTQSLVGLDNTHSVYLPLDKPTLFLMGRPNLPYNTLKAKNNFATPIIVSGSVQTDFQVWGGDSIPLANNSIRGNPNYQQGSGVTFTNATIFTAASINRYATTIVSMMNDGPSYGVIVNRAMFIFGNLDDSPFYFTIGRNFLPLGTFQGNGFLQNTINTNTVRSIPLSQAVLSYADNGFNIDAGLYQNTGAAYYSDYNGTPEINNNNSMNIGNYFANVRYNKTVGNFTYILGAGFLSDIRQTASILGMMYNKPIGGIPNGSSGGSTPFTGGQNPLALANISLTYKDVTTFAEYTNTLNSAKYNGKDTGRFSTWVMGLAFTPTISILNNPINSYLQVNYSGTENMQNVSQLLLGDVIHEPFSQNIGVHRQAMTQFNFEIFHNIYVGPEFQYMWLYNGAKTWVGSFDVVALF